MFRWPARRQVCAAALARTSMRPLGDLGLSSRLALAATDNDQHWDLCVGTSYQLVEPGRLGTMSAHSVTSSVGCRLSRLSGRGLGSAGALSAALPAPTSPRPVDGIQGRTRVAHARFERDRRSIDVLVQAAGGRSPKAGGRLLDGRTWSQFPVTRGGAVRAQGRVGPSTPMSAGRQPN
jgi:hypothetical protein